MYETDKYLAKEDRDEKDLFKLVIKLGKTGIGVLKSAADFFKLDKVKQDLSDGSYSLDFISIATDNYSEYGEFSTRYALETALEGALTVGTKFAYKELGQVVGTVVAAAVVYVFPPALPASGYIQSAVGEVVGVATRYVSESMYKYIFGSTTVEYMSDTIINVLDNATGGNIIGKDSSRNGAFAGKSEDYLW